MIKEQIELEDFITKVLTDIDKSVADSREKTDDNFIIIPNKPFDVEFDLAVTVSSSDKKGLGISVASIIKVEGKVDEISQSTSRIKFKIPLILAKYYPD